MSPGRALVSLAIVEMFGLAGCTLAFSYPAGSTEICTGGADEDLDGMVDCEDSDCDPSCGESPPAGTCADGRDNDHDGLTDREDVACWGEASARIERCVTVRGDDLVLEARDWFATHGLAGLLDADRVTTPFGEALAVPASARNDAIARLHSARPSTGARWPISIELEGALLVADASGDLDLRPLGAWFGPSLPDDGGSAIYPRAPDAAIELVRVETSCTSGSCQLVVEDSAGERHHLDPISSGWHHVHVRIELSRAAGTSTRVHQVVEIDGAPVVERSDERALTTWTDSPALDVLVDLGLSGALGSVRWEREPLVRCGREVPSDPPVVGVIESGVWTATELCLLGMSIGAGAPTRVLLAAPPPDGETLPDPEPIDATGPVQRLRSIAVDPRGGELIGVLESDMGLGFDFVPVLARAPRCEGPWVELGPAFAGDTRVMAVSAAARSLLVTTLAPGGEDVVAVAAGDAAVPASFGFPVATGASLGATGAMLGNDWITTNDESGVIVLRRLGGPSAESELGRLTPSGERGTLDEAFVVGGVLVPAPARGRAPDALLFFGGSGVYGPQPGGVAWVRAPH